MTEKTQDEIYEDRNLAFVATATTTDCPSGWYVDLDEGDPEWAIVWIETPMGQVGKHIPSELIDRLGYPLPNKPVDYDGHDRETGNDRLANWIKAGMPS